MNNINDVMYIYHSSECKLSLFHGIQFKEFISDLQLNLILLRHQYVKALHHEASSLDYIHCNEIVNLAKENIYIYGDFCWVDFSGNLDKITSQEIAALLFMTQQFRPLNSPFFPSIKNKFVYLSHDDGWLTKFYSYSDEELLKIISDVIKAKTTSFFNINIKPIPISFSKNSIYELLKLGVIFDFNKAVNISDTIKIPLYLVGEIADMDSISKTLPNFRKKRNNKLVLAYANEKWSIVSF